MFTDFYKKFEPSVKEAFDKMPKKEAELAGEDCPNCGHPLSSEKENMELLLPAATSQSANT